MSFFTDKSVEVEVLDNGWVLRWKDEGLKTGSAASLLGAPKTLGVEVFTRKDKKKLLDRISSLI